MSVDSNRTAFYLTCLHQRKDDIRITAIAVDSSSHRVFVGLSNGHIEEHQVISSASTRLVAEKRFSRHPIANVCCLPGVQKLAVRDEENSIFLCSYETFNISFIPSVKLASAIASDDAKSKTNRLAIATKSSKKTKIFVYVLVADDQGVVTSSQLIIQATLLDAVESMNWIADALFLQVPRGYKLLLGRERVVDIALDVSILPMIAPIPSAKAALLLFSESMLIMTDSQGVATREPLLLPGRPLAVSHSAMCIVVVCDDGVHVMDANSWRQVQHIHFRHDDPRVALSGRMARAEDTGNGAVWLATSSRLLCLQPVALQQQVYELLKRRSYSHALEIMDSAGDDAAAWVHVGRCQAALLMLVELRWTEAVTLLASLPPAVFQPSQLFPLFPSVVGGWLPQVPRRNYWGLVGPLKDLQTLVEDWLEIKAATSPLTSSGSSTPRPVAQHTEHSPEHRSQRRHADDVEGSTVMREESGASAEIGVQEVVMDARRHLVEYLLKVRSLPGIELRAGLDVLIVSLLCATDQTGPLEALVTQQDFAAELRDVETILRESSRWHALALLHSCKGRAEDALNLWQRMESGTLQEAAATTGAVSLECTSSAAGTPSSNSDRAAAAAAIATSAAAVLLSDTSKSSNILVLARLPWLMAAAPERALQVIVARPLPIPDILTLLSNRTDDLRWRYLNHLVYGTGTGRTPSLESSPQPSQPPWPRDPWEPAAPVLHTELALELIEVALAELAMQQPDERQLSTVRNALQHHLRASQEYQPLIVLQALGGSSLHAEAVLLHARLGDHKSALRVLALTLADVEGVLAYCRQVASQDVWLNALTLFLSPGADLAPDYSAAVRVLAAAEGAELDPAALLAALHDDMPLALAHSTLSRMMSTVSHRRRTYQVTKALRRAVDLTTRTERAQLLSQRILVTESSTCRGCQRTLGSQVFYRYPSGVLMCVRCVNVP